MNEKSTWRYLQGVKHERERIIALLKERADDWFSHDGTCDCSVKGEEVDSIIALINRETVPSTIPLFSDTQDALNKLTIQHADSVE